MELKAFKVNSDIDALIVDLVFGYIKQNNASLPKEVINVVLTQYDEMILSPPKPISFNLKIRTKPDAICQMKRGTAMLKYNINTSPNFRRFQISSDLTKLFWYSPQKPLDKTCVLIKDIKDILDGQQTDTFKQCTNKSLETASFSIVYTPNSSSSTLTLDLVSKSAEEASLWIKGLKGLIRANSVGKLHKVVQIIVNVNFKDISKISKKEYRFCSDERKIKYDEQYRNYPANIHEIIISLIESQRINKSLDELVQINAVRNSNEYIHGNIKSMKLEIEERLNCIEYGLQNKSNDLTVLMQDAWILKIDAHLLKIELEQIMKN